MNDAADIRNIESNKNVLLISDFTNPKIAIITAIIKIVIDQPDGCLSFAKISPL